MNSDLAPPPEGRCELEPRDVTVAEWSRAPLQNVVIVAVVSVGQVVLGYLRSRQVQPGLVWHALLVTTLVTLAPFLHSLRTYSLPLEARRCRFVLTAEGLGIFGDDGSARMLPWNSLEHQLTREGLAVQEKVTGDLHPLPRRAWGPPSAFVAVRAFVTDKTAPAKLPLVSPVVLVWLVIVVLQTVGIR